MTQRLGWMLGMMAGSLINLGYYLWGSHSPSSLFVSVFAFYAFLMRGLDR